MRDIFDGYEYGIVHRSTVSWGDFDDNDLHRSGMYGAEAKRWITEWIEDGGDPEAWLIVRRWVGNWEFAPQ